MVAMRAVEPPRAVAQVEVSPEDASELLAVLAEGVSESMPRWLMVDDPPPT